MLKFLENYLFIDSINWTYLTSVIVIAGAAALNETDTIYLFFHGKIRRD